VRRLRTSVGGALAVIAIAATAAPAYGQSSSDDAYNNQGGAVAGQVSGTGNQPNGGGSGGGGDQGVGATSVGARKANRLPFTGADIALLGVAGAFLVALGAGMRRVTRRPNVA
jgi:hypothetical protein